MNEFESPTADHRPTPVPPHSPLPRSGLLTRPRLLGLSLPWLVGIVLVLAGSAWYLFWPVSVPDINRLAFGEVAQGAPGLQPVSRTPPSPPSVADNALPATGEDESTDRRVPEEVVRMIHAGHDFATANREAISRLSDTVRAQNAALATLQKQMADWASGHNALLNRLTVLEARTAAVPTGEKRPRHPAQASPLAGMRLESVQGGMAWVNWQGRTWAVQAGDSLGPVRVKDVNAAERQVLTSGGVLR
ncbi:conjugal transfer protein TraP [Serratia symbiotica]|uniref:conjugal transfer protein TraP n=1 Tax=Serratia symbiotica TaxID=138074 RepID=UPI001CEFC4FB|nr:conjugal transfer protein TraP [Serratia symbiotica]